MLSTYPMLCYVAGTLDLDEFERLIRLQLRSQRQQERNPSPEAQGARSPRSQKRDAFLARAEEKARKKKLRRGIYHASASPPPRLALPVPSREMVIDWFNLCDTDHDGTVSFTEFFAFSLREALARSRDGSGVLRDFLNLWDHDIDQALDVTEFGEVARALGFESVTEDLLKLADTNGDGLVDFPEMVRVLRIKGCVRDTRS